MIALKNGREAAKAIKVGDTFEGAMPAADRLYKETSLEHDAFISGFLQIVKKYDILVDDNSIITGFTLRAENC